MASNQLGIPIELSPSDCLPSLWTPNLRVNIAGHHLRSILNPQGASRRHAPSRGGPPQDAAYRLATAKERLGSRSLFPRPDGQPWRDHNFRNWRRRIFKPAARNALQLGENDPTPRPYDLRHTFVSLLIAEGHTIARVAAQAGHSAEECARTYLHRFDEHGDADPAEQLSAEDAIRARPCTD